MTAGVSNEDVGFTAGRDLRFHVHDLDDATIVVDDLGGEWEAIIGEGRQQIELKAGGDVVLTIHTTEVAFSFTLDEADATLGAIAA